MASSLRSVQIVRAATDPKHVGRFVFDNPSFRSPMERNLGPFVVVAGIVILLLGVLIWAGGLSWFGRLPGDIRIERGNVRVYIPVVSMLLVSVVGTLLLSVVRYLFRR